MITWGSDRMRIRSLLPARSKIEHCKRDGSAVEFLVPLRFKLFPRKTLLKSPGQHQLLNKVSNAARENAETLYPLDRHRLGKSGVGPQTRVAKEAKIGPNHCLRAVNPLL